MASLDLTLQSWLDRAAVSILACCLLYVAVWAALAVRVRIRRTRRIRATALPRLLPLVGLAVAAGPRHEDSMNGHPRHPPHSPHAAFPWSESDGWSPPRPSDSDPLINLEGRRPPAPSAHPAIHPDRRSSDDRVLTPLFERAGRTIERGLTAKRYEVVAGDSLWKIAQRELRSADPVAIQNYWQKIFETNRSVLGADPDLIYAGQTIKLPGHKGWICRGHV